MDSIQLGKKIKEARLSRKMTQSDVVGTFITRNMLSQIESGNAFPSIKTLEYLSQVLEIPMHHLMPTTDFGDKSKGTDHKESASLLEMLSSGKALLLQKKFSDAAVIFERLASISNLKDEAAALMAQALLGKSMQFRESNQLSQAANAARKAAELSEVGLYANREIKTNALLLLDQISDEMAVKK